MRILIIMLIGLIFLIGCTSEEQVFCAQDAKVCPDGSYVSRMPPDCEFEACPEVADDGLDEALEELEEIEDI